MFNNKQEFVEEFTKRIEENYGRSVEQSHPTERFMVLGEMVRDFAGIHWKETKEKIAAGSQADVLLLDGVLDRPAFNQ